MRRPCREEQNKPDLLERGFEFIGNSLSRLFGYVKSKFSNQRKSGSDSEINATKVSHSAMNQTSSKEVKRESKVYDNKFGPNITRSNDQHRDGGSINR